MNLIVLGDEFAAGAYVNFQYIWATDDEHERYRGPFPHPQNICFTFGYKLSQLLHIGFHNVVVKDNTVDQIIANTAAVLEKINDAIIVISWHRSHCGELKKIEAFGNELSNKKIVNCFVNSSSQFESSIPNWLWDTKKQSIASWAKNQNLLNPQGYLTSDGHTNLANSMLLHLTNQMPSIIINQETD